MIASRFLMAASALALSTGTAWAQGTNTSEISQTGTNNILVIDNARAGNDQNRSVAIQNGRDNRATIVQISDFNVSQFNQIGDRNVTTHTQEGDFNRAESFAISSDGGSAIRQRGLSNSATVNQSGGNRNTSQIAQGTDATASRDYTFNEFYDSAIGVARGGNDNRASVSQVGSNFNSTIRQRAAAGSSAAASNNSASVMQRGQANSSTIVQESRGNSAVVMQFGGGATQALQNITSITQGNSAATSGSNPLSNNRANVSVSGQSNSGTISQNGIGNSAELTQGLGQLQVSTIAQVGSLGSNQVRIAQYGDSNAINVAQNSANARADVWQQAGPAGARSSNNAVEIQQGTGTTGSTAFSAAFFNNTAPTGNGTANLTADVTQGGNPAAASWNRAEIRQDGVDLTAIVRQAGVGTSALPNIARIAQQGGGGGANRATIIQTAGVGPSAAGAPASGVAGDEFFFGGGARSAEATILQSGSLNSATIEQRGQGQVARIEQGPGGGNVGSILQEAAATNATAVIRQIGNNNSYSIVQTAAGQYISVSQTGSNNSITNIVERP